jgi:hypothetical protein
MTSTNAFGTSSSSNSVTANIDIGTILNHSISGSIIPTTYISGSDSYTYYTLNITSGTYTFIPGTDISNIQLLIVGGGGAGGALHGGGGGAGGLLYYPSYSVSPLTTYASISIGGGGVGGVNGFQYSTTGLIGGKGGNTTFNSLIALGGGGGSFNNFSNIAVNASLMNGGSGGGKGGFDGGANLVGPGTGTAGQGTSGATNTANFSGGGGGSSSTGDASGNGGDGTLINITGSSIYYAGGGAGSTNFNRKGIGGLGGGGGSSGGGATYFAFDGNNYGSGGGGTGRYNNYLYRVGGGYPGVVIIAFKTKYSATLNPPTNLAVTSFTISTIVVSFSPPSGTVTSYLVSATSALGEVSTQSFNAPISSCTISGLKSGINYTIKIASLNISGRSIDSNSITQTTKIGYSITYPDTYSSFRYFDPGASFYNSQFIDISGGLSYKNGRYTASASSVSGVFAATGIPSNAFNIINKNGPGWLAADNIYSFTYLGTAKTTYNSTLSASGEWLQIQLPYSLQLKRFTAFGTGSYEMFRDGLLLGSSNGTTWNLVHIFNVDLYLDILPFSGPITKFVSTNVFYSYYRFVAIGGSNVGSLGLLSLNGIVDVTTSGTLNPPTNLTVSSFTYNSITISFTQPNGTITNYNVCAVSPDGTIITQTFASPATSYVITALQPNTTYNIIMSATNTTLTSVNSNMITQTTADGICITFPDSYATFTLSPTYTTDVLSNTVTSINVSGETSARNGTYIVRSSSAYNSQYVPYIAFVNDNSNNSWRSGQISTSLGQTGILAYSTGPYYRGYEYRGTGSGATTFNTAINNNQSFTRGAHGEWIQIQFPFSINLSSATIKGEFNGGYILGSNNGTTWSLIHLCMIDGYKTPSMTNTVKTFTFTTESNYSYIRLVVSIFNRWDFVNEFTTANINSVSYSGTIIV